MNERTVLVVAHGSREASGNAETAEFVARWRQMRPQWRIELCFIEHAEILLDEGLDRAAEGAREVVVLPLILNAAGHVKMELPQAIERARARGHSSLPDLHSGRIAEPGRARKCAEGGRLRAQAPQRARLPRPSGL